MQGISKTLRFVILLVIIFGLAGYYVYYTFTQEPVSTEGVSVTEEVSPGAIQDEGFSDLALILNKITFDTSFLSDPTFVSLKDFYKRPNPEEAGVANPFTNF